MTKQELLKELEAMIPNNLENYTDLVITTDEDIIDISYTYSKFQDGKQYETYYHILLNTKTRERIFPITEGALTR